MGGALDKAQPTPATFGEERLTMQEERLAMQNVETDGAAKQIGEPHEASHGDHGVGAEIVGQQRKRDEEARADDGGERRDGRAPYGRRRELRREQQRCGRRQDHEDDDIAGQLLHLFS